MARVEKIYLGDGVYAEFDGWHIVLTTIRDITRSPETIYLEPEVLEALDRYREHIAEYTKEQKPDGKQDH